MALAATAGATGREVYVGAYSQQVNAAAQRYGVPALLLAALLKVESGFNRYARSSAGAEGIAQFMPSTAAGMGINPWNPNQAIPGAARYLAGVYHQTGSWAAALRHYNTGSSAPSAAGGAYVDQVTAAMRDLAGTAARAATSIAAVLRSGKVKLIGYPYQGTHAPGATTAPSWQSDNAVDIAMPVGTPVYALAAGVVSGVGFQSGTYTEGGKLTLTGAQNAWWYGHLSKLAVSNGQKVKAGQLLGYSGEANGVAHLHLGQERGTIGKPEQQSLLHEAAGWVANAAHLLSGPLGAAAAMPLGAGAAAAAAAGGNPLKLFTGWQGLWNLADTVATDPAYPLLWLGLVIGGVAMMLWGLNRMAGGRPAEIAQQTGQTAALAAV